MQSETIKGYTNFYQSLVKDFYKKDYNRYHNPLSVHNDVKTHKQDDLNDVYNLCDKFKTKSMYKGYKGALELIRDIGYDYDGSTSNVDDMKSLVDELVQIACAGIRDGDNYDGITNPY